MTYPVGIIGVGNMGGAMAMRLRDCGWPVHVCDTDPARIQLLEPFGAVAQQTPAQLAINSVAV
ncbi:MAG TPA: NAD(P)-binding domain-containing protein, partial [Polaromonas sp.]|uniref:NAD(P)-binding domain-containing protein n=1 Tax=Polaromonas sp. TaxID=1869339 RepID=UPI002D4F5634